MFSPFKKWIQSKLFGSLPDVPRPILIAGIIPLALAIIGLQIYAQSSYRRGIDQKFFHPVSFSIRHRWNPEKLDPKIKIFSFDDRTASYLKNLDLSLETWGLVIKELSRKDDIHILIPKFFDGHYSDNDIALFSKNMDGQKTKVSIATFTSPGEIPFREPISDRHVRENQMKVLSDLSHFAFPNAMTYKPVPYGAHANILEKFKLFGHSEYDGSNRLRPFININDQALLPYIGLTAAHSVEVNQSKLFINSWPLKLAKDGKILINFAPKEVYQKISYSFLAAVERAKRGQDISVVQSGDYVVILPAMYTGNTDFQDSPFGPMPSGYTLVSVLNSVLTGQWLTEVDDPGCFVLLLGLLGFWLGAKLKPRYAILSLIGITICGGMLPIVLFTFSGMALSPVLPLGGFLLSGVVGIAIHNSLASIEELRIQRELEVATMVQNSFFPDKSSHEAGHTNVGGRFLPASECGGDWWGVMRHHGYTYVMLGDAVGHGVPAALVTAVAFSVTRTLEMELAQSESRPMGPATILKFVNDVLCRMQSDLACMTFLAFRIHDESGECVVANAGNPQPILIPADAADPRLSKGSTTKKILARGDVLGLSPDVTHKELIIELVPGDRILLHTDGLIENRSQHTKSAIGQHWLKLQLKSISEMTGSHSVLDRIWNRYLTEIGTMKPDDDVTVVVISRHS